MDPKHPEDLGKVMVRVLCVSKKSRGTVVEEGYSVLDLEAVPATSIPRAGIAIFGGMATEGVHVRVRAERKDATSSKSLGRTAFGDVGTVTRVDGEADDNLKVFVTCNGLNPEEQTGDWYEPEDLEEVDQGEQEGEPVFGGRVVVGSMVRVMQSGRGKKCLGTMEIGDLGSVKGIDPNAADNLKINVTCGRSPTAKQSEWYDPRDLQVFFGVEDTATPLAKAQAQLDKALRELGKQRREPEYNPALEAQLKTAVDVAQKRVNELSKETVDMTKTKEVYENAQEKLQSAQKLKRDIEALRLTASKQTTCAADPGRAARFTQQALDIEDNYYATLDIIDPDTFDWNYRGPVPVPGNALKPVQYSDRFKSAWKDLYRAWQRRPAPDPANDLIYLYRSKLQLEQRLRDNLANGNRNSPEDFDNLTNLLSRLSNARIAYDAIPVTPLKSALKDIDEKLQKLKEVARDIETAAYSGNTPSEKLLARIGTLIAENNAKQDIIEGPAPNRGGGELGPLTTAYNTAFADEQQAKFRFEVAKQNFQKNTTYSAIHAVQVADFQVNEAQTALNALQALRPAQGAVPADLAKRIAKAQEELRKKTNERDLKRAYNPLAAPAVPLAALPVDTPQHIVTALTTATREYINAQKDTLRARKAEQIKSGELTCLLQSTEAAMELQDKIRKIVNDKCMILADADAVNAQIDNLIDVRKRAFLMAHASRDPSFGKGPNAGVFSVPVGTDFAGRIQLMNDALARITANPTIAGLNELIELCGTYGGDTLLDEARAVATRTYRGGFRSIFDRSPRGIKGVKQQKQTILTNLKHQSAIQRAKQAQLNANARTAELANQDAYISTRGINPFKQSQSQKFRELAESNDEEDTDAFDEDASVVPEFNPFTGQQEQSQSLPPRAVPKSYSQRFRELANPAEVASPDTFEDNGNVVPEFNPFTAQQEKAQSLPPTVVPKRQSQRFRELANPAEVASPDNTSEDNTFIPETNPFTNEESEPETTPAPLTQSQRFRDLANPKVTPPENPFKPTKTQSQRFRDLIDRDDKKAKEEGAKWLAKEQESRRIQRQKQEQIDAKIREKANKVQAIKDAKEAEAQAIIDAQNEIKAQNEKLTQDILDISDRLAKDQVLRLKMLVVSNSTAVDLAQQLTIQGDRLEQEIRNSRTEFQFNIAQRGGANGSDFKIQNDVDYYKEELEKCKMCIVNFKKKAIDQYNLDMANLEQKKEELKSKVFEIKEPQEANKGSKGKDWAERSVDEINKEIANVKARLAVSGIKPDEKASKEKFLAKLQSALASKKSGGYRRRITLRQPPKPRHRVY